MIDSQSVSATLYVPLLANIYTSKNFSELLHDPKALELEASIPANSIGQASTEYHYLASASRYHNMEREIKNFIGQHIRCNIINIGAGLDTVFYRVNSITATFYEIDLPPVIAQRRKLLPEQEHDVYIDCSFLEVNRWMESIRDTTLPTLLVASGVFHYFKPEDIHAFFRAMQGRFPLLEVVFDCTSQRGLKIANSYVEKTGNQNAKMYFYIDSISRYLQGLDLDITLIEEYMMYRYSRRILKRTSLNTKISMLISDWFSMLRMEHIRLN